jgi:arginyl-tRNA synthetase
LRLFFPLTDAIARVFPDVDITELVFAPAPKLELGDIALRTFEIARQLGAPPPKVAAQLVDAAQFGPEVTSVTAAGPFLNFKLDRPNFARRLVRAVLDEKHHFGSTHAGQRKRVLMEHTSINPNASPHVGRGRCAMIGDSIARLLRFDDYDVEVHYYVNDMGRQIGLLVLVCEDAAKLGFDDVLELYVQANARAEQDPAFAEQGYALLAKMEEGDPDTKARFKAVTDVCLRGQLEVLARINAAYDVFDRESDYVKDARLDAVLEALRARGALFTDDEQRLVVDLSKLGYTYEEGRFFVLMRANGSSMYGYRDIAYTLDKRARGADIDLQVLGEDHKLYQQQLALILQTVGADVPETIYYAYITLKEGKMSTRHGNVVLLSEFLDEATTRSLARVREQCTDLAPAEQEAIAAKVAVAAIRFAILRVGPNKNVVFDWDSALSFSGDTGPYIQYSCARINSILRKFGEVPHEVAEEFPIRHDAEWRLVVQLAAFPELIATCVRQRNAAPVATYALETARLFTAFYHDCPVINAESPALRNARAQLCLATRHVLENALQLLGIETPERM